MSHRSGRMNVHGLDWLNIETPTQVSQRNK